ncbi:MAG: hypothetical protein ACRCYR_05170 [Phycicoccus sp.]
MVGSGIAVAAAAHVGLLTRLGSDVPAWQPVLLWTLASLGAGFVLMPVSTVATRSLEPAAIPSGSTVLGVIGQSAGAVAIAGVSVLLAATLTARLPAAADGDVGALSALPPGERAAIAPQVADAFQAATWLPLGLIGAAGVLAVLVLAGEQPSAPTAAAEAPATTEPASPA